MPQKTVGPFHTRVQKGWHTGGQKMWRHQTDIAPFDPPHETGGQGLVPHMMQLRTVPISLSRCKRLYRNHLHFPRGSLTNNLKEKEDGEHQHEKSYNEQLLTLSFLHQMVLELCLCSRHNISPGNPEGADQPKTMEMSPIC